MPVLYPTIWIILVLLNKNVTEHMVKLKPADTTPALLYATGQKF